MSGFPDALVKVMIKMRWLWVTLFLAAGWLSSSGLSTESPTPECSFDAKSGTEQGHDTILGIVLDTGESVTT